MLALCGFLASAVFTLSLQNSIPSPSLADCDDMNITAALSSWRLLSNSEQPPYQSREVQKLWDGKLLPPLFKLTFYRELSHRWIKHICSLLVQNSLQIGVMLSHHSRGTETHLRDEPNSCLFTALGQNLSHISVHVARRQAREICIAYLVERVQPDIRDTRI